MVDWSSALEALRRGETLSGQALADFREDGFGGQTLGLRVDEVALDRLVGHIDCDERHHQPYGIVHGGVWCSVVESMASLAGAVRAAADGQVVVGVSNATDFLRAHRRGRVEAVAEPVHVGRTQQLWQVVCTRASDGKAVARGQVRLANLDQDRELAAGQ